MVPISDHVAPLKKTEREDDFKENRKDDHGCGTLPYNEACLLVGPKAAFEGCLYASLWRAVSMAFPCKRNVSRSAGGAFWGVLTCLFGGMLVWSDGYLTPPRITRLSIKWRLASEPVIAWTAESKGHLVNAGRPIFGGRARTQ